MIGGQESDVLNIAIVLDLTVNLVDEECLHSVVELEFPDVGAHVSHGIVGPVSVLNTVKQAVMVSNPETVLESVKIDGRVEGISGRVKQGKAISVVATVLLLGQVLYIEIHVKPWI